MVESAPKTPSDEASKEATPTFDYFSPEVQGIKSQIVYEHYFLPQSVRLQEHTLQATNKTTFHLLLSPPQLQQKRLQARNKTPANLFRSTVDPHAHLSRISSSVALKFLSERSS